MSGGQVQRFLPERDVELDFLSRDGPFPPDLTLILSALDTEAIAVKVLLMTRVRKVSCLCMESSDLNATSDGEFTRVGACDVVNVGGPEVRPTSESSGKTR